jgi:hypothetical protein
MLDKIPGSPDWYLDRLARQMLSQQGRYDMLENYMTGNHPLPDGDKRYVTALRELQRKARTNYFSLVTVAPVERMKVIGFRFGATQNADKDAASIWQANNMSKQSARLHLMCAVFGNAYVTVSPPNPLYGHEYPILTVEDPRYFAVEMDPARPGVPIAALKMWNDDISGKVVSVLYMQDAIFYYVGAGTSDIQDFTVPGLTSKLLGGGFGSFELMQVAPNPLSAVPVVDFGWMETFQPYSAGEAEGVIDIQDRINSEILNRLIISRSQAYKQRLITGVKIPEDKGRGKKPPFDPGADMLWVVADPNAKIYEFKEADISQLLAAVRDDVGDMAAITKTPPHYLLGEVVNVSGDALKAAETGLVSKTKLRMENMSWGWEMVLRLCFKYQNDPRASEVIADVIWDDPESKSRAELADAMTKEVSAGVPLALAMQRARFTPEEIEFAVAEQRKAEARQAALQAAATRAGGVNQGAQRSGTNSGNTSPTK